MDYWERLSDMSPTSWPLCSFFLLFRVFWRSPAACYLRPHLRHPKIYYIEREARYFLGIPLMGCRGWKASYLWCTPGQSSSPATLSLLQANRQKRAWKLSVSLKPVPQGIEEQIIHFPTLRNWLRHCEIEGTTSERSGFETAILRWSTISEQSYRRLHRHFGCKSRRLRLSSNRETQFEC